MENTISTIYPIRLESSVIWGDMDSFGHLNNCLYFRLFESSRIVYFETVQFPFPSADQPLGPILASTSCEFKKPLRYPDRLRVEAGVQRLGRSSLGMAYRIIHLPSEEVAAEGTAAVVLIDYRTGKSVAIPSDLRDRIDRLEEKTP